MDPFFIDTTGDSSLLEEIETVTVEQEFIRLPTKKELKKQRRRQREQVVIDQEDEDFALMMDYIQNAEGLDGPFFQMGLAGSDSEELESGLYDALVDDLSELTSDEEHALQLDDNDILELSDNDFTTVNEKMASKSARRKENKRLQKEKKQKKREEGDARLREAEKLSKALKQGKGPANGVNTFVRSMNVRIHQFCAGKEDATLLPPMPSNVRQTVLFLLQQYGLNSSLRGSGDKKILNVYRTKRTHIPPQWKQLDKVAMEKFKGKRNAHFMPKSTPPKTPKAPDNAARPKLGDIVGEKASPIAESNIGHKMLAAMGWTPGQGLGASGAGIVDPVAAIVRSKRGGLGGE